MEYPSGFHWISMIRVHFSRGHLRISLDFNECASILQRVPRRISLDFNESASVLHEVPLRMSLDSNGLEFILQVAPPKDFIGFQWICIHFTWGPS